MPCEHCAHYVYDEYGDYYYCDIDLDEDEMISFMEGNTADCPYYDSDDEYEIVRHQM